MIQQLQRPNIIIYNQPDCVLPKSFFEGRFPPKVHPESLDWEQWCAEQHNRCLNGWTDGGFTVSNVNYYHLNFKKINMLDSAGRPMLYHPYFSFEDQELFNDIKLAREQRKGLFLVTGRGWGKSFDISSLVEHEFTFYPASECIVSASTKPFADLLWDKIEMGLNSQPDDFPRQGLLVDSTTEKALGWSESDMVTKSKKEEGYRSIIRKVIYDSDPEKTRGTRPNIHVWEEVGSWTGAAGLLECYKKTEASWWRGSVFTCFPIFIGTGGAMDTGGSIDAKTMFFNPDRYNLLPFEYKEQRMGKFFAAFKKLGGYYERTGISDNAGAKTWLENRRETKKADPTLYRQETMEFPFEPREAFQVTGSGLLPVELLEQRFNRIESEPELQIVTKGFLDWERDGSKVIGVKWRPAKEGEEGIFEIAEHPVWTRLSHTEGKITNLYVAGCDSFDAVMETNNDGQQSMNMGKSPGCDIIFKRFWRPSDTGRIFVAKLTQRTSSASEFYENTLKLNLYYNAKMLAEYTKIGIFQWYITKGFEYMLYERPKLDQAIVRQSKVNMQYGLQMPIQVKLHVIKLYHDYIKEYHDQMYFGSQILDGAKFTMEGRDKNKHDETMASAIAICADTDMLKLSIYEKEKKEVKFPVFQRNPLTGKLAFG